MENDRRRESDQMIWVPVDPYVRPDVRRPALERRNELRLDRREAAAEEGETARAAEASAAAVTTDPGVEGGRAPRPSAANGGGRRHVERRRSPGVPRNRTAGFLKRFRQPIIGVGLAGAALPMVAAMDAPGSPSEEPEPGDLSASRTAAPAEDVEEALAERVGNEREFNEREQVVQANIAAHGIARDMAEDIYDAARAEGIEPDVAFGLVRTESTFREDAKSHVGALGLTQVMPRTAAWLEPGTTSRDLYDRQTNLRLGFRYLDQMIDKYRGDVKLALLAYNRGPGTVDKVLKRGGNPDNGYADKVLGR